MAELKRRLAKKIQDNYKTKNNTLIREVKPDPKDRIEIEVGDAKQPDFKPQVKIKRWDNEVNFSMRAEEHPEAEVETRGEQILYKTPQYEVHQYEKHVDEDGGFEFEWVLPEKPASNVLQATIQTKGLDFFYQPALTEEEIAEGHHRPENAVGSYAVYHKTKRNNRLGGKEYKTGKAFHIYRPHVRDAEGNETWGELHIDEEQGLLTVTVDEGWLDSAIYPVVVDPTFGYTSIGASLNNSSIDRVSWNRYVVSEDGDLTAIHVYVPNSGFYPSRLAVYNSSGIRIVDTTEMGGGPTGTWVSQAFSPTAVTSSNNIFLLMAQENYVFRYDADVSNNFFTDATPYQGSTPPGIAISPSGNLLMSLYVSYDPDKTELSTSGGENIKSTEVDAVGSIDLILSGVNIVERGFVWDTESKVDPGNVAPGSSGYANNDQETGSFSTGSFSLTITGLTKNTTYYLRAYAKDSAGDYTYGNQVTFDANRINRSDTSNADFSTGTHSNTAALNNNVELAAIETLVDSESFETGFGDWTNIGLPEGDNDWIRETGGTPSSSTGPSSAQSGSFYIYVETSNTTGGSFTAGEVNIIEYDLGGSTSGYVDFYYHQYGINQGTLYLEGYTGSAWEEIWSSSGNQGNQWNQVTEADTTFSGYEKLRFRNVAAGSFRGDVALDNINVYSGGSNYQTSGTYTSDIISTAALNSVYQGEISWSETLNGQTLTVETNVSINGGTSWIGWKSATNGGSITDSSSISDPALGRVRYRVTLSGSGTATPELNDITLYILYEADVSTPTITASDTVGSSESVNPSIASNVWVEDTTGVIDAPAFIPSETVFVNENVNVRVAAVNADTSEPITVSDSPTVAIAAHEVNVADETVITEAITTETFDPAYSVSVSDEIGVTDTVGTIQAGGNISVTETPLVSEGPIVLPGPAQPATVINSDSIGSSESVELQAGGNITVSDAVVVDDSPNVVIALPGTPQISATDNVGVVESAQVQAVGPINVSEASTVSESTGVLVEQTTALQVVVADNVATAESFTVDNDDMSTDQSETVSVTESISVKPVFEVNTSESVTVSESAVASAPRTIRRTETVFTFENHARNIPTAAETDWNLPDLGADDTTVGSSGWTNPGNITASDDTSASKSVHTVSANAQNSIKLIVGGSITGNDKSTGATVPTGGPGNDSFTHWGGSTDTWGVTLSATDINATDFGVGISITGNLGTSYYLAATDFDFAIPAGAQIDGVEVAAEWRQATATVQIDSVQMKIYYTTSTSVSTVAIGKGESVSVSESVDVSDVANPNISDSITVTENLNVVLASATERQADSTDNVSVSESVSAAVSTADITVSDSISTSESVSASRSDAAAIASDTVMLTESVTMGGVPNVVAEDGVTVTEIGANIQKTQDGAYIIDVRDEITVTEFVDRAKGTLSVVASDTIQAGENIVLSGLVPSGWSPPGGDDKDWDDSDAVSTSWTDTTNPDRNWKS